MTEPQAPVIDAPEPGKVERFEHVIVEPVEGVHTGYVVHFSKPTNEQLMVLLRLLDLAEDAPADAVRLYGDTLEALMDEREGFRVQRGLIKGHVKEEHISEMGPVVIRHYFPEAEGNRETRRAATRRPKR